MQEAQPNVSQRRAGHLQSSLIVARIPPLSLSAEWIHVTPPIHLSCAAMHAKSKRHYGGCGYTPLNVICGSTVSPSRHHLHMSLNGAFHRSNAAWVSGGSEYMPSLLQTLKKKLRV